MMRETLTTGKRTEMAESALAIYLRRELERRGLTQQDLERDTDIPDSTLSRILNGQVREPKASQLAKIAKALGVPFWRLMEHAGYSSEVPGTPDEETKRIASILSTDPELQRVLDNLMRFDEADRRAALDYILFLRKRRDDQNDPPPLP